MRKQLSNPIAEEMGEHRSKGVLTKNNQTFQLPEPDARPLQFIEHPDILTQTTKPKGLFTTNNRALAISYFYESNFGPKNQVEHSDGLSKFPNLFNKQKSEFLKFANVNEPTSRIIKSYSNTTRAATRAAGRPSGSPVFKP